ncbi:hypothetical protein GCM10025864_26360 [Luteimicrobium album]|uniref:BioF2-like acetyltransferase domain-containing protein n=1 Tax=Luteimicrobium album TaxID=1054550 RepID=A0ABQ6I335_9MICO|nr:GNAT family N-acetyltransferase [Luteimicrobium album]GMA24877.1 hypothetical protein GCM10025864_26360 [Luteimicrobium album]
MRATRSLELTSASVKARTRRLRVVVETLPSATFKDALGELCPDLEQTSRDVLGVLAEPTSVPKRNVLVMHGDEPVLATTLRARHGAWEVATATCVPTLPIPHRPGMLRTTLSVLGADVLVPEYFGDTHDFPSDEVEPFDVFVADLTDGSLEGYWRSTGLLADARRTARKTESLHITVDKAEALTWMIDTWETNWKDDPADETGAADDLRTVWPELVRGGAVRVIALADDDGRHVAAASFGVHDGSAIALVTIRDHAWPLKGGSLGTRIAVETITFAREAGLARFDLGGYHDYKRRIAPPDGVRVTLRVGPAVVPHPLGRRVRGLLRPAVRPLRSFARGAASLTEARAS